MAIKRLEIPLNRVEGDLEIHVDMDDDVVVEANCVGTMYRGFETLLEGRGALDGLVITPRICGICSTAHLKAAAKALDMVFDVHVPDNALRIRNATLMVEQIQNDVRHAFLLFAPDFTQSAYRQYPGYAEACRRYLPLKGDTARETIHRTKNLIEIIAILGGHWPHSSFMVPGGVLTTSSSNDISQCRYLLQSFRKWYEQRVLGCSIDRWLAVDSPAAFEQWLNDNDSHQNSELGFFIRFARKTGLDTIGGGAGNFISFGSYEMPEHTAVQSPGKNRHYLPAGVFSEGRIQKMRQESISEHIKHSWFEGYEWGRHPFGGLTQPNETDARGEKYSWAKAPRYEMLPVETGPLAEMLLASHPLFSGMVSDMGPSVFARQLARLTRPAILIPLLDQWLGEVAQTRENFFQNYEKVDYGQGYGLIQAPRGALGHWVKIKNGKIDKYQIITPTAWNASPKDTRGRRGPCEEALVGTRVKDKAHPVELHHIIRSFDPCLVCTVHVLENQEKRFVSEIRA